MQTNSNCPYKDYKILTVKAKETKLEYIFYILKT